MSITITNEQALTAMLALAVAERATEGSAIASDYGEAREAIRQKWNTLQADLTQESPMRCKVCDSERVSVRDDGLPRCDHCGAADHHIKTVGYIPAHHARPKATRPPRYRPVVQKVYSETCPEDHYVVTRSTTTGDWSCTCPDHFHRDRESGCKHIRKVKRQIINTERSA